MQKPVKAIKSIWKPPACLAARETGHFYMLLCRNTGFKNLPNAAIDITRTCREHGDAILYDTLARTCREHGDAILYDILARTCSSSSNSLNYISSTRKNYAI